MVQRVVLLVFVVLISLSGVFAQQGQCPNIAPQAQPPSVKWGNSVVCPPVDGQHCGQNQAITFSYTCDIPSTGKKCVAGDVVILRTITYTCPCEEVVSDTLGTSFKAANCLQEPPGGGGG